MMNTKGETGKRGAIGMCPRCRGYGKISWKPDTDISTCECGWSNAAELPQLYKTDPEPLPEDAPQPLPDQPDPSEDAFERFAEALKEMFAPIIDALTKCVKTVTTLIPLIDNALDQVINLYPNKRVIHLAKYGKGRTKKKNINRILKWYNDQAKTPSAKRSSRGYLKYIERDGRALAVFAQN